MRSSHTSAGSDDDSDSDGTAESTSGSMSTTTESTGAAIDCPSLDAGECRDANECMPIEGSQYVHVMGTEYCFEGKAFAGCIAETECDQAETYGCDGNDKWLFATTCLPDGWVECDAPEGDPMTCE